MACSGAAMVLMNHVVLIIESISFLEIEEKTNPDLCSYTKTGNSLFVQEYFFCYTCGMDETKNNGVCKVCVKTCHADHDVKFYANTLCFCDCGMEGETYCQSLLKKQSGK